MTVAARVAAIAGMDGQAFNAFPSTCHFATSYWLYHEEFGSPPTLDNYLGVNLTQVASDMLPHGGRQRRPSGGAIAVVPGTVLVFANDGQAGHSCIVRADGRIGGYNQENWFTTAGNNHRYSEHDLGDIEWANGKRVRRPGLNHPYDLYAIPENVARAVVRKHFQR